MRWAEYWWVYIHTFTVKAADLTDHTWSSWRETEYYQSQNSSLTRVCCNLLWVQQYILWYVCSIKEKVSNIYNSAVQLQQAETKKRAVTS